MQGNGYVKYLYASFLVISLIAMAGAYATLDNTVQPEGTAGGQGCVLVWNAPFYQGLFGEIDNMESPYNVSARVHYERFVCEGRVSKTVGVGRVSIGNESYVLYIPRANSVVVSGILYPSETIITSPEDTRNRSSVGKITLYIHNFRLGTFDALFDFSQLNQPMHGIVQHKLLDRFNR